jgi:Uma2 family endonuclease
VTQLAPRHSHSFAAYLQIEEVSGVQHEIYAGEIYAMAGGSPEHAAMPAAITNRVGSTARGNELSRVLGRAVARAGDGARDLINPDVTVICGPSVRDPESATHVTNPKLAVEVLSPGTEEYDPQREARALQASPSLSAVDHRSELVQLWAPNGDAWSYACFGVGEQVPLDAISM